MVSCVRGGLVGLFWSVEEETILRNAWEGGEGGDEM